METLKETFDTDVKSTQSWEAEIQVYPPICWRHVLLKYSLWTMWRSCMFDKSGCRSSVAYWVNDDSLPPRYWSFVELAPMYRKCIIAISIKSSIFSGLLEQLRKVKLIKLSGRQCYFEGQNLAVPKNRLILQGHTHSFLLSLIKAF